MKGLNCIDILREINLVREELNVSSSLFISEGDPDNFLTYFKRATVFLAMGRSKAALPDLDRVLELRPDFFQVCL